MNLGPLHRELRVLATAPPGKVPAPTFTIRNLRHVESFSQLLRFTANKGGEVKILTQAILVPRQLVITVPNCWSTSIYLLAAG